VNAVGSDAERFGEDFAHFGKVRAEFGTLENDDGVNVFDDETLGVEESAGVLEKDETVGAFPLGIGVGEMRADVAEARGTEQGVAKSVSEDVAIGMTNRTFVEGDLDTADDELPTFREAMKIVADAAAGGHDFLGSPWR